MCEDFAPNFGDTKNWLLHHDNAPSHISFFTRNFLTKDNVTIVPNPPHFSVLVIEDKTERLPF
jgi:hypothetical protein